MTREAVAHVSKTISIICSDGLALSGHLWETSHEQPTATVVINPATGVAARYYYRYAAFLAEHGFDVITYDYRGIGLSRPQHLRGCGYRWRDWGELDFDAVIRFAKHRAPSRPLLVVGHSIGGFLLGFAKSASTIDRILTVGAQYAYWWDYAPAYRARLFLKWHLAMPAMTALFGYFPGKKLGWLEDLPAGVANEWSFRPSRMEQSYPRDERAAILERFASVSAPTLAIAMSDDELATVTGIRRALSYYRGAHGIQVLLSPQDFGFEAIGHFGLFHDRHTDGFWRATLNWLHEGRNPWPHNRLAQHCED